MQSIKNKVPEIYHRFLPELLQKEIPFEAIATCHNCTFQRSAKRAQVNTKCCSYYPQLPNYLVGGILLGNNPNVAKQIIKKRLGVSPFGFRKPLWYKKYEKATRLNKNYMLKSSDCEILLCPFYDQGHCTIWPHREHACASWHCFSVGGDAGRDFYNQLDYILHYIERKLAKYVANELGCKISLEHKDLNSSALNADDELKQVNQSRYEQLWAGWNNSEEAFYIEAYYLIQNLTQERFSLIMGNKLNELSENIQQALSIFWDNLLPKKLKWNPATKITELEFPFVQLNTDLGKHRLNITKLPILQAFDGSRSTVEVAHLAYSANSSLSSDISKLLDIDVLVIAD
jgi:hypothetical protein